MADVRRVGRKTDPTLIAFLIIEKQHCPDERAGPRTGPRTLALLVSCKEEKRKRTVLALAQTSARAPVTHANFLTRSALRATN